MVGVLLLVCAHNNAGIIFNTRVAEGYRSQFSVHSNNAGIIFNTSVTEGGLWNCGNTLCFSTFPQHTKLKVEKPIYFNFSTLYTGVLVSEISDISERVREIKETKELKARLLIILSETIYYISNSLYYLFHLK